MMNYVNILRFAIEYQIVNLRFFFLIYLKIYHFVLLLSNSHTFLSDIH